MYDFIIVGAGSSGCVLAGRLTEDPAVRVLLIEAGGPDSRREISIPLAFSKLFHTEYDWNYRTAPQPGLDGRALYWPRGKVLGGSSALNAMMWVRGVPGDYDAWAVQGNVGWGYADVLPYFKRAEAAERVDTEHAGASGPLFVQEQRDVNPGTHLFVEACIRAGIPRNLNANAGDNSGVDYTQVTQNQGRRWSAAAAYLGPASKRPNLEVVTGAHVTRLEIDQRRATGVSYLHGGELHTVRARGEVVLSAGAVGSPHLLQLSGVGPATELERVGIRPVVDLPGVGENLMDHLAAGVIRFTSRTDSLANAETLGQLVRYVARRRGMLTSNVGEAHAFISTAGDSPNADIELLFAPVPYLDHGDTAPPGNGYTIGTVLLQPQSRGTIRATSASPLRPPSIDPRYLSDPADLATLAAGLERAIEVFDTPPLGDVVGDWIRPERRPSDRTSVEDAVRRWSETLYHPAGTCRMGSDDLAVVDHRLRVHGIEGLRVADASVMPTLNRGHTHAPAIMIGEKAVDLIRSG